MPRLLLILLFCVGTVRADPVSLTGANGHKVEFAGIWEARPDGLVVLMRPEANPITVAWDKFDLDLLKAEQPAILAARDRALFLRVPQPLNLGLFAGILTQSQVGSELRRILETTTTLKIPAVYRTKTETTTQGEVYSLPGAFSGIAVAPVVNQHTVTETETRQVSPDTVTTTLRRVLEQLTRFDGVLQSDRRAIFDLCKGNPDLLENAARQVEKVRSQLPPLRLLANDPTLQTLSQRLTEAADTLRDATNGQTMDRAPQERLKSFLALADHPLLK